ncbi:glutathione S-transferase family protein [Mesorhizobium sp. L-8-3]|uniref:glutathione S-transferase family protein n=1 Tax=Mesorhizobium sp. L-8-3 TaxID=2744522 RepID=UPI00192924AD|nr:glutathione S-transferase [Mesorhizobium sp. L-8-3]BCH26180.1 glutathione S-transferase [Mesorhizobium sp. L-8-3]
MSETIITLHGMALSGHTHRVELMLLMLGLPYRFVPVTGEVMRSGEFRRLNPLGQIPVLQDGDLVLADSNAILVYLAKRYAPESGWLPEDAIGAHHVQRWLSIAAGELRYGPANARLVALWGMPGDPVRCAEIASRLLHFMEDHLAGRLYLAADQPTIADLACYAYVAHAPEGGIELDACPSVRAWLKRIEALPGFKAMPSSPLPKAS